MICTLGTKGWAAPQYHGHTVKLAHLFKRYVRMSAIRILLNRGFNLCVGKAGVSAYPKLGTFDPRPPLFELVSAALAHPFVLCLGIVLGLPMHVLRSVCAATGQRIDVVDHIAQAWPLGCSNRWEVMLDIATNLDS